ncbi:PilZ domain-containing protein [Oxalobacteraceae sp. CFBP 13730]|nr:PilZ domain-containing protein [Oxalobacteraceae sp. CFBP 13730]
MLQEQRQSPRKVLRTKVLLAIDGRTPFSGKSVDISANGISVNIPDPVPVGLSGQLRFDLMIDGRFTTIDTHAKALHCIFSGGEYKVGFKFQSLDLAGVTALARFLR